MKRYNVTVNGTAYEVMVEEVKGGAAGAPVKTAPAKKVPDPAAAAAGGEAINAPMPGTILSVKVKPGQAVKSGDVLMVLEAMKMENEIMAPRDGRVASVTVTEGASVESGALLCTIS